METRAQDGRVQELMNESGTIHKYWWAAALLGFLAPGAGQLYTGRARLAAYALGAFLAFFALFQTSIPSTFAGFVAVFGGAILVGWGSAIEASVYAWRRPEVDRRKYHRWYVCAAYVVAFAIVTQGINAGALTSIGQPSMFGAYKPYRQVSRPLEPGLLEGEYFWVENARGATTRQLKDRLGSIVIVRWPDVAGLYVFRLVAIGGQRVAVNDRKVLIDGKALPQRVICEVSNADVHDPARRSVETVAGRSYVIQNFDEFARDFDEVALPDDYFYVLGDTRENSNDSRFRGPVANENYAGRALFVFWSKDWSRIGKSLAPSALIETAEYCPPSAK
jgi:signal peptidase I